MGFYGQVTNTSNTHFQFDKIFPNRAEMESELAAGVDKIFAGRFVLVKYSPDGNYPYYRFLQGFRDESEELQDNIILYSDKLGLEPYIYTTFTFVAEPREEDWETYYIVENDTFFKLPGISYFSESGTYFTADVNQDNIVGQNQIIQLKSVVTGELTKTFYKCLSTGNTPGQPARWVKIIADANYDDYFTNYQIDLSTYGDDFDSRGYDATVWQKVYSEGNGKFLLVAHLNGGGIPAFELFPSPPSLLPEAPYIDSKSTDALYRVHVPTHWGFSFKTDRPVAEGGFSEEKVIYNKPNYDSNNNLINTTPVEIDADIFINKQGAIIEERHRSEEVNKVELTPTGRSGKTYFDKNGNPINIDTLELSLHVPAIGNMISDGYDLIYGYQEKEVIDPDTDEIITTYPRTVDISWIDGSESDDIKYNGYNNNKTHDLHTLAGTLNTMHDTLGQNVIHLEAMPSDSDVSFLSDNYIYEVNHNFYRRGINYKTITIGDYIYKLDSNASQHFSHPPYGDSYYYDTGNVNSNGESIYSAIATYDSEISEYYYRMPWCVYQVDPEAQSHFEFNKYYENIGTAQNPNYVASQDLTWQNKTYYLKNINPSRYTEIQLLKYEANRYFLLEGENYIVDKQEIIPSDPYRQYYTITPGARLDLSLKYEPNKYYKIDEKGNYIVDSRAEPDPLDNSPYYVLGTYNYAEMNGSNPVPRIYYLKNKFYYENISNPGTLLLATEDRLPDQFYLTRRYYAVTFKDEPHYGKTTDNEIIQYYEQDQSFNITQYLTNLDSDRIFYMTEGRAQIIKYENLEDFLGQEAYTVARTYYRIPAASLNALPVSAFYLPRRYYIHDENGNYVKANSTEFDNTAAYYLLGEDNIQKNSLKFYIPNKYYYDISNGQELSFELATSSDKDTYSKLYEAINYYVDYDENSQCPHGYQWSNYAAYIPPSIHLYAREEKLALIPMGKVYAGDPSMQSINDILLYLNRTYDANNENTRDLSTFRGTLNSIRDLLYQIKTLQPGKVLYVNDFGQITSSNIDVNKVVTNP